MSNRLRTHLAFAAGGLFIVGGVELLRVYAGELAVLIFVYVVGAIGMAALHEARRIKEEREATTASALRAMLEAATANRRFHEGALQIYEEEGVDHRFPIYSLSAAAVEESKSIEATIWAEASRSGIELAVPEPSNA